MYEFRYIPVINDSDFLFHLPGLALFFGLTSLLSCPDTALLRKAPYPLSSPSPGSGRSIILVVLISMKPSLQCFSTASSESLSGSWSTSTGRSGSARATSYRTWVAIRSIFEYHVDMPEIVRSGDWPGLYLFLIGYRSLSDLGRISMNR